MTLTITIDDVDRDEVPARPWTAAVEITSDAGTERSDAAFGATPLEALTRLLTEHDWTHLGYGPHLDGAV